MNSHELLDVVAVRASSVALREAKFFSRSLASPPIGEVVSEASITLDTVETDGKRDVITETPAGQFNGAYLTWRWYGDDVPTLIFHHGSGENPFDFGRFSSNAFRRLFATDAWDVPLNLIAVRAPFHDRSSVAYARSMGNLADFVGMCASSTVLVNALTEALRERGCPGVVVCGISLGGWVTNLHRAFFGTADRYVPIFAGASLGEMFATSVYRTMTGKRARADPDRLRQALDFDRAFVENTTDDCSPLLARYDRIIEFEVQQGCYGGLPLTVIDKGHITGSLSTTLLREHVRDAIPRGGLQ